MAAEEGSRTPQTSQIVIIPQLERSVRWFDGQADHQDLERFLDEVEAAWARRPDQADPEKAAYLLSHLGNDVRDELRCQGVGQDDKTALLEALQETYGDRRSLSHLSLAFHSARQEGYEGVRQYSTRLHTAFMDLNRQQRRHNLAELDEACLRNQFIEGLHDEHLRINLKQLMSLHPHSSFQELRKTVLSWTPHKYDGVDLACSRISSDHVREKADHGAMNTFSRTDLEELLAKQEETLKAVIREQAEIISSLTETYRFILF
ncbi:hypothetical protein EGW08_018796 [Elysia chlorotica]|uniref:Uncharacterized protein n=1 Tax=Elysia chlorotica TaxID=188477 RepID=A0A3S1B0W0_ELYCH|nr:hypothetical protein EGW08_018796 [Elysia chlorotica]